MTWKRQQSCSTACFQICRRSWNQRRHCLRTETCKAYELGITDYITRPFDSVIVKKRVQNTLGLYANQKHLINVVYDQVYEKEENNNIMIQIMSNILGSRNSESREHILHIKTATEMMLRQLVKVTDEIGRAHV